MATEFTLRRDQTFKVVMLDEGEKWEGEAIHWDSPADQEEAAMEQADELAEEAPWVVVSTRTVDGAVDE